MQLGTNKNGFQWKDSVSLNKWLGFDSMYILKKEEKEVYIEDSYIPSSLIWI